MAEARVYAALLRAGIAGQATYRLSFALELLNEHMATCVRDAAAKGGEEAEAKVKEASDAIARLVRS